MLHSAQNHASTTVAADAEALQRATVAVDLIDQRLIVNGGVYLMVLDATNGKTLREVPFMEPIQSVLTGENDSLIIVAPNGRMVRLDPHG